MRIVKRCGVVPRGAPSNPTGGREPHHRTHGVDVGLGLGAAAPNRSPRSARCDT